MDQANLRSERRMLKQLSESLLDVGVRLDVAATSLEFELLEGQSLRLGEEDVKGHARRTVVTRRATTGQTH